MIHDDSLRTPQPVQTTVDQLYAWVHEAQRRLADANIEMSNTLPAHLWSAIQHQFDGGTK